MTALGCDIVLEGDEEAAATSNGGAAAEQPMPYHGVMVVHGRCESGWVDRNLMRWRGMLAQGAASAPVPAVVVGPPPAPPPKPKLKVRLAGMHNVDGSKAVDREQLRNFVEDAKRRLKGAQAR